MSFYGSTYYQLVDAFGKILFKNDQGIKFPRASDKEEAAEAIGRRGVMRLGAGNRWISFSKDSENANSFIISHAAADPSEENVSLYDGFSVYDAVVPTDKLTVLESGNYIKVPSLKYDKAGHIIKVEEKYVRLPETDFERDISELEENVSDILAELDGDGDHPLSNNDYNLIQRVESNENITKRVGDLQEAINEIYEEKDREDQTISEMLVTLQQTNEKLQQTLDVYDVAISGLKARIEALEKNQ